MIQHVRHQHIDKAAWDRRLTVCGNALWYGLSSTLDAASPGWDALIDEETGAQFPITWRRKYGVRYVCQPFIVQQLGPFALYPATDDPLRFFRAWPRAFPFADIRIRWSDHRNDVPGLVLSQHTNHELRLDRTIDELRAEYSVNHQRSLRKALKTGIEVDADASTEEVIGFLEASEQFKRWRVDRRDREAMRRIFSTADATGAGFRRAVRHAGELVAASYFVKWGGRITFLKGLSSAKGRELRAMHLLIDAAIAEHAGQALIFDFAGGDAPQLARFYAGFGAEQVFYLRALMNRLPPLIRRLKY